MLDEPLRIGLVVDVNDLDRTAGRIVGGTEAYRHASGRFTFRAVSKTDGTTQMTMQGRVVPPARH